MLMGEKIEFILRISKNIFTMKSISAKSKLEISMWVNSVCQNEPIPLKGWSGAMCVCPNCAAIRSEMLNSWSRKVELVAEHLKVNQLLDGEGI